MVYIMKILIVPFFCKKYLKMDNNEPKEATSNEVSCISYDNIYKIKCVYPNMNIILSNLSFCISII